MSLISTPNKKELVYNNNNDDNDDGNTINSIQTITE